MSSTGHGAEAMEAGVYRCSVSPFLGGRTGLVVMLLVGGRRNDEREDCWRACFAGRLAGESERSNDAADTEPLLARSVSSSVLSGAVGWRDNKRASLVSVPSSLSSTSMGSGGDESRRFLMCGGAGSNIFV